ncbi:restriction endonuclease [Agromyces intestinalis]|uniref:Restriction endonuclease n=1 Tax=Agromyces intestinalis TaxID=2592652 RepID=A0A5C1YJ80_9MICO|nr:restriction endonuclease [Agromyces intestinalis]
MAEALANPIVNSPYEEPQQHFVIGPNGPTGELAAGRRPSEFFIPVPKPKKGRGKAAVDATQLAFDLNVTDEKIERNDAIDQLRDEVRTWRLRGYERVSPISKKLLRYWADPARENRILFAQREAAETAIFLAEVVSRRGYTPSRVGGVDWRELLGEANAAHNAGLPRVALKMATGSGKTVVMAMLIAWQTLNKIANPNDARFAKRFLIVTPGITIRDRLQVLQPDHAENYYDQRGIVPPDLRQQLGQAQIAIVNYHQFLKRQSREIKGVNANTRKMLLGGRAVNNDPFEETPQAVVSRILRDLGRGKGEIVVLNDEAHHCYQQNTTLRDDADLSKPDAEAKAENEDATVWFRGLQWLKRYAGVKTIYDLSATPFYLKGSGWSEGLIFPWTVSDFSLMDAIESGIVKVPRLPVDDDFDGKLVSYLQIYDQVKDDSNWPRTAKSVPPDPGSWNMPAALEGALRSLYRSYEKSFADWQEQYRDRGEPPPVMIVVSPNTFVSKLIYDWIAGYEKPVGDATVDVAGELALFSNVVDDEPLARPRTIIVDSKQLESGEALKGDFKSAASEEIEAFKRSYREQNPGADVDTITDADLLREVMNTVGKKGKLGEQVRCVVSVAMLTEGWDANTVTHILGVRAFRSQLLCEQVVGRGLRRRSYEVDPETGRFGAEYSNVYGIPFAFIPSDKPIAPGKPADPPTHVRALSDREHLRIDFPVLSGYRVELPDEKLQLNLDESHTLTIGGATVPSWVQTEGIVGEGERIEGIAQTREQEIAFKIAGRVLKTFFDTQGDARPWLFPQLVDLSQQWIRACVHVDPGYEIGYLSMEVPQQEAAEAVYHAITRLESEDARRPRLRPILRAFGSTGTTAAVDFQTRKKNVETTWSHVSHVTLDGKEGNEWEKKVAKVCEGLAADGLITSYVKNDQLGFAIPYVHKGRAHEYWPDFILKIDPNATVEAIDPDVPRYLIVEVSGTQKSHGPTQEKARTARDSWCVAVNNHGGFGRWGYIELGKPEVDDAHHVLRQAIRRHVRDESIIGDHSLLNTGIFAGNDRQSSTMEG